MAPSAPAGPQCRIWEGHSDRHLSQGLSRFAERVDGSVESLPAAPVGLVICFGGQGPDQLGEWLGRVRDKDGRITWIPGSNLRPI